LYEEEKYLLVAMPLALDLPEDVDPVVVAQGAGSTILKTSLFFHWM
jgi:hypothetical protein